MSKILNQPPTSSGSQVNIHQPTSPQSVALALKEKEQRAAKLVSNWETSNQLSDVQTTNVVKLNSLFKDRKIPAQVCLLY